MVKQHSYSGRGETFHNTYVTIIELSTLLKIAILALVCASVSNADVLPSISAYSGSWTLQSPTLSLHNNKIAKRYYYETVQLTIQVAGTYTFTSNGSCSAYGDLYQDEFHPENLSLNKIAVNAENRSDKQFTINVELSQNGRYVLVVMSNCSNSNLGQFSILASGPTNVQFKKLAVSSQKAAERTITGTLNIPSSYQIALTSASPIFSRPNSGNADSFYYSALQIVVSADGMHTFVSSSSVDTYACLYTGDFSSTSPSLNLMRCDDDSGGGSQFRIEEYLTYYQTYVLVVTTYSSRITGSILIVARGPPSTSTTPSGGSVYTGTLTTSSSVFTRPTGTGVRYYYQSLRIEVTTSDVYTFACSSSLDTFGYLYSYSFDSLRPTANLITSDDDSNNDQQFRIRASLQSGFTYILVVTTYKQEETGRFTITVSGPYGASGVSMSPIFSDANYFDGTLTTRSPTFSPSFLSSGKHYFNHIRISVSTSGTYRFQSVSSLDTYGLFYESYMSVSNPLLNLLENDDDGNGNGQFRISVSLQSSQTYYLVVTTYYSRETGSFRVDASGPGTIEFTLDNPPTSSSEDDKKYVGIIVGISVPCFLLIIICAIVFITRHKRKRALAARATAPTRFTNSQQRSCPVPVNRNTRSVPPTAPTYINTHTYVEEPPPPSYEMAIVDILAKQQRQANGL
ncbi:unnamed protein product [Adineta ricciae]|uniref:Uncharacterized protein n=1 Tax=Adineta ricciae TaxID=249248 RepID=A0A814Y586_ADIRI|nr:unnamed protein product [Adineta ricciae]CAF1224604.1 unnamed protein product [Adineta ricciae]